MGGRFSATANFLKCWKMAKNNQNGQRIVQKEIEKIEEDPKKKGIKHGEN